MFAARIDVGEALTVGPTPQGLRRVVSILGGRAEGPGLRATALPGGADWQLLDADGTARLKARYTLRADDSALVYVRNEGIWRGPPDVLARLTAGEPVDGSEYYFRAAPRFEMDCARLAWLNDSIFIATGAREARRVLLDVFRVA